MPKSKSGRKQVKIENELRTILEQFGEETIAKKEVALNKAADYLVKKLQDNTSVFFIEYFLTLRKFYMSIVGKIL